MFNHLISPVILHPLPAHQTAAIINPHPTFPTFLPVPTPITRPAGESHAQHIIEFSGLATCAAEFVVAERAGDG